MELRRSQLAMDRRAARAPVVGARGLADGVVLGSQSFGLSDVPLRLCDRPRLLSFDRGSPLSRKEFVHELHHVS
jgi:hypothetical protein